MNKEVSFPIAKLLKEKGFDKYGYLQDVWLGNKYEWRGRGKNKKSVEIPVFGLGSSSVLPTIADVVMWLYEKHGIWISVSITIQKEYYYQCIDITGKKDSTKNNYPSRICKPGNYYNSPTEAYEAAFEHTLNNLI